MFKNEIKIIPSVNWIDVIKFVEINSSLSKNLSIGEICDELDYISENFPDQVEVVREDYTWKVIVNNLKYDGWIKNFTETQNLREDYYILFTN